MTFFKRQDIGRVYVLRIELPDQSTIHKIGMCNTDRATDRMLEVLRSWFNCYRYIPCTEIRLDMECGNPAKLESFLHKVFESKRCFPDNKVDGSTEMFYGLDEFRLLHYIRKFNIHNLDDPLNFKESDYRHICELLCPKN